MVESIIRTEKALLALEALGYDRRIAIDLASRSVLGVAEAAEALIPLCAWGVNATKACELVEGLAMRVTAPPVGIFRA